MKIWFVMGLTLAAALGLPGLGCDCISHCPHGPEGGMEGESEGQLALEGMHEGSPEGREEGTVEGAEEGSLEGLEEGGGEGDGEGGNPDWGCTADCTYEVVRAYPHDPDAFTQGLVYEEGSFYESTGLYGSSSLRKVDAASGSPCQMILLPNSVFGEGLTLFGDRLIQLTWKEKTGYVYNKNSLELIQEFQYGIEGWGITHDGGRLIVSDGSSTLYFWHPETFEVTGSLTVRYQGQPVRRLNELEYIHGLIYANVWQTNRIAKIAPDTGDVIGWIYLDGLLPPEDQAGADVLNGIAYDAQGDRLFVTGKRWPKLFEITLKPK